MDCGRGHTDNDETCSLSALPFVDCCVVRDPCVAGRASTPQQACDEVESAGPRVN